MGEVGVEGSCEVGEERDEPGRVKFDSISCDLERRVGWSGFATTGRHAAAAPKRVGGGTRGRSGHRGEVHEGPTVNGNGGKRGGTRGKATRERHQRCHEKGRGVLVVRARGVLVVRRPISGSGRLAGCAVGQVKSSQVTSSRGTSLLASVGLRMAWGQP